MTPQSARGHSGVITRDGDTEVNSTKTRRALSQPIPLMIWLNSLRFALKLCAPLCPLWLKNAPGPPQSRDPRLRRPATKQLPKYSTSAISHRQLHGTPGGPAQMSTIPHAAVSGPDRKQPACDPVAQQATSEFVHSETATTTRLVTSIHTRSLNIFHPDSAAHARIGQRTTEKLLQ